VVIRLCCTYREIDLLEKSDFGGSDQAPGTGYCGPGVEQLVGTRSIVGNILNCAILGGSQKSWGFEDAARHVAHGAALRKALRGKRSGDGIRTFFCYRFWPQSFIIVLCGS
jgi:hypothetical protein